MTEQRAAVRPTPVPLSRNRNYQILWGSQALSLFGINATFIAFPLLVLALSGSPAASGLVLGVSAAAELVAGVPAGALADRWDRKRIMLVSEAIQVVTTAGLVAALWWHLATVPTLLTAAIVLGACESVFRPAETACLPNLVPTEQVSGAVAGNAARAYLGNLSGTAAGGFLFAVGRAVPFVANLLAHAGSFVALLFLKLPQRPVQPAVPIRRLGAEMAEGLRFLWRHRHIRVTALCAVVLNLFFSAFYIVVIVLARTRGLPSGEIGIMAAMLGVGGIVGAFAAPHLTRVLSPYQSIISVFWTLTVLTPLAVFIHNGYLMGLLFAAMALLPPSANTAIISEQLLRTPDELRGRLSGVLGVLAGVAAALGPPLGGALTQAVSGTTAVLLCCAGIAVVTVLVTASPTLRHFPAPESPTEKGTPDG
ncbi:MAG TPA: MFS transporter [Pseudonocardiaceae bacterium]|jgi:MFS family permease|nr:MFS transporter [Pseudonocardiaceae bacterium]